MMSTQMNDTQLILNAIQGVQSDVQGLKADVQRIDQRVTALETGNRPRLLPRSEVQAARPAQPQAVQMQPVSVPSASDRNEQWVKEPHVSRCYKIGITKTRSRMFWRVTYYIRGWNFVVYSIGRDGEGQLIEFLGEVCPELSEDHFDEALFASMDQGQDKPPEISPLDVTFMVQWYFLPRDEEGKRYKKVEAVYSVDSPEMQ